MRKYQDITGNSYGNWLVIERSDQRANNTGKAILWRCICICGNEKLQRASDLIYGRTKGCLSCNSIAKPALENILYKRYIYNANKRQIDFSLNFREFLDIIYAPCYFCNRLKCNQLSRKNKNSYILYYNGVDRLDNNYSYTKENSVPCCGRCNQAKNNMSEQEFLNLIELIYKNRIDI